MKEAPLIARRLFFDNPDHASVQLSPDGKHLSWLAPVHGVLNVWSSLRDDPATARSVTHDTVRGIFTYLWSYTNSHILYLQDRNGDENWRLYATELATGNTRDLTPFDGVRAQLAATSCKFPEEVVVGLNRRNPQWHDIYRINIVTGEMILLLQHDRFNNVIVDDDYRLRYAGQTTPSGGVDMYIPVNGDWQLWDSIPVEDVLTTSQVGFDKTNRMIFMKDSRGRNTSALVALDPETKISRILAASSQADAAGVMSHPTEKHVQAVSFIYERKSWQVLDPSLEPDFAYLRTVADGDIEVTGRSLDDHYWVVVFTVDDGPARFYLYDRHIRVAKFLFTNRKKLENQPLSKMRSVIIKSRDGLDLVAYYTVPTATMMASRINRCRPSLSRTEDPGGGISGVTIHGTNGLPAVVMRCCRSISVRLPASAKHLLMPETVNGAAKLSRIRWMQSNGPSGLESPIRSVWP